MPPFAAFCLGAMCSAVVFMPILHEQESEMIYVFETGREAAKTAAVRSFSALMVQHGFLTESERQLLLDKADEQQRTRIRYLKFLKDTNRLKRNDRQWF